MTQLQAARKGIVTEAMKIVAADEGVEAEAVRAAVATGEAVIPLNVNRFCVEIREKRARPRRRPQGYE